jgi:hypothetical protein
MIPNVTVSVEDIRNLATAVDNLFNKYIKPSSDSITSFAIYPGDFADGRALDEYVKSRITELRDALKHIGEAMTEIKIGLNSIAAKYAKTEDETVGISQDLDKMIKDISGHLSGFEV